MPNHFVYVSLVMFAIGCGGWIFQDTNSVLFGLLTAILFELYGIHMEVETK